MDNSEVCMSVVCERKCLCIIMLVIVSNHVPTVWNKCMNKSSCVLHTITIYLISAQIAVVFCNYLWLCVLLGIAVVKPVQFQSTTNTPLSCVFKFKFTILCKSWSRSVWGRLHWVGLWSWAQEVSSLTTVFYIMSPFIELLCTPHPTLSRPAPS